MSKAYTKYSSTTYLVLCGLFAALTAICSFITIPLGFTPVPLNLGTLGVFLTGGLLGRKYGCISIAVYILLGLAGIPVFAGLRAGLSVLAGPTGGYIIGYLPAAFIIGILTDNIHLHVVQNSKTPCGTRKIRKTVLCAFCMAAGLAACYASGTAWFMYSTGTPLAAALVSCVVPFIAADVVKIFAAAALTVKLKENL